MPKVQEYIVPSVYNSRNQFTPIPFFISMQITLMYSMLILWILPEKFTSCPTVYYTVYENKEQSQMPYSRWHFSPKTGDFTIQECIPDRNG